MLEKKIKRASEGEKIQPFVEKRGQICKQEGLLDSSVEVCEAVRPQYEALAKRAHEKDVAATLKKPELEKETSEKRAAREQYKHWALGQRISKHNVPNKLPRSLKERRAVAWMRASKAKNNGVDRNANRSLKGYEEIRVFNKILYVFASFELNEGLILGCTRWRIFIIVDPEIV